ncbi:MAG: hypothetical protein A2Y53_01520 [Chloroflexi bacterium RBG_16_47_49]|nr:MAG: hypothetical protein A2Y53_01520 [Chloroflexi bacterium RBG_16_47_49]
MEKRSFDVISLLIMILFGLGMTSRTVSAANRGPIYEEGQLASEQLAAQTPSPTVSPAIPVTETPESRVLPPVGDNAGLVLGASVLVLIVIGGVVISSRRKPKH